jgi:predicted ester cyclase
MGVPPTGKRVDCSAITIQRIAGGVIVEGWTIFDALGMMQQIGVVPSPGQAVS